MESLVEEAMQVVVEQELEAEELPATLQVDYLLILYFCIFLHNRNTVRLSHPAGGAFGLASSQGGEGGEGHGHVARPPGGGQDHSQFWRGGLMINHSPFYLC